MDIQAVKKYISVIERAIELLKKSIDADYTPVEKSINEVVQPTPAPIPDDSAHIEARKKHVQDLMAIDCWPIMVPGHLQNAIPTDEDKINLASSVMDMMVVESMENKRFLDFGCGEGWIARESHKRGVTTTTGYDLQSFPTWDKMNNVTFTTNIDSLTKEGYDVIFLYDVLDHCVDPLLVMEQVRSLLSKDGIVYIRCHPWCSKHASHLYKKGLNKAYVHLFLTWDELVELGYEPMFTRTEVNPLEAYRWWFSKFKIELERPIRTQVSEFFYVPSFVELVWNEQRITHERREGFIKDMEMEFVDYILKL